MVWFAKACDPPRVEGGAEAFVLWLVHEEFGASNAALEDSIDHDLDIVGDDAVEFIEHLRNRFGIDIWAWPWNRFVELDEGLSVFFPFVLIRQLATWPARGRFSYPSTKERLTLGHIAFVLERGEWIDP